MLSERDKTRLASVDYRLVRLVEEVSKNFPLMVICGHRGEAEQNAAFEAKKTKVRWPNSKHNFMPSKAVDLAPTPLDWNNKAAFVALATLMINEAKKQDVLIRWGGDWDLDGDWKDEKFLDMPHFELME